MKPTDFATLMTAFLSEYLPTQRNVSPNTIKAYRDAFTLFLRYCRDQQALPPEKLTLDRINVALVLAFLEHLETERGSQIRTRNHRLSALHAFFRFVQGEAIDRLLHCQQILAIPLKRCARPTVNYLAPEEMGALLARPDLKTRKGRRDVVLLSVLYDTGARVQELIDLSVGDLRLNSPAQVRLTGKGRKTRAVPLLGGTVDLLRDYLRAHHLDPVVHSSWPLFPSRRGERLTRAGIRYLLSKYWKPGEPHTSGQNRSISPHTLRHSKAMHLLHAGNPAVVIQAILGHEDIRTTDIYARANIEMMKKALEKAENKELSGPLPSWREDKNLLSWLASL